MKHDVEAVKHQADIVGIIGQYVQLRQESPDELKALCPFHKERTPSFSVTPSKGRWFCFGCQTGGDIFTFIQSIESVTFPDAVAKVAELAGVVQPLKPMPVAKRNPGGDESQPKHVATYTYTDEHGVLVYEKLRFEPGRDGRKKDFRYRRKHPIDGKWIHGLKEGTYRKASTGDWYAQKPGEHADMVDELPECPKPLYNLRAVMASDTVGFTEGEKDADSITKTLPFPGTTLGGVAGKIELAQLEPLRGKQVLIFPDMDEVGLKRAREIAKLLQSIAASVTVVKLTSGKDVTEYIEAGQSVEDLIRQIRSDELERRGLLSAREILEVFEGGIDALLDPSSRKPGLKTGFADLDTLTNGLKAGELIVLAGRPAMGKTAFGVNIGVNVALGGNSVAIFSLEMAKESLLTRIVCAEARVDSQRFMAGRCGPAERSELQRAMSKFCARRIFIDDAAGTTLDAMHGKLLSLRQRVGLDLVVIDYLQLMVGKGGENRTQEVSALTRALKVMAREFKVPVILLSQVNRACETRNDKRPTLADLRESGSIEQDADVVGFLFRPEYYAPDRVDLHGVAELNIAKQRNGPTSILPLIFLKQYTKFEDAAQGWHKRSEVAA